MNRRSLLFLGASAAFAQRGFKPLWNGRDLSDFKIDTAGLWSVEEGMIVGRSPGIKYNEFLRTKKTYGDFHLKAEFKMTDPTGKAWLTGDIYDTQALVTIFTMGFISVLCAIRIAGDQRPGQSEG